MNTSFLIIDEENVDLEEKVHKFIIKKFGEKLLDKILIDIYTDEEDIGTPDYTEYLTIEIKFKEYTYNNKAYGKQIESVGMVLENKGLQPFYIDGKFVTLNVYEWIQGNIIQKHDTIYGFNKDEISDEFTDFILTC